MDAPAVGADGAMTTLDLVDLALSDGVGTGGASGCAWMGIGLCVCVCACVG